MGLEISFWCSSTSVELVQRCGNSCSADGAPIDPRTYKTVSSSRRDSRRESKFKQFFLDNFILASTNNICGLGLTMPIFYWISSMPAGVYETVDSTKYFPYPHSLCTVRLFPALIVYFFDDGPQSK